MTLFLMENQFEILKKSENAWKCFENDANDDHGGELVQSHILVSL